MATTGATQTGSRDQRSGSGYLLPADAGFEASGLPGLRKAAILIMGVGDDVAKILLSRLNESDVQRVTDEITRLGGVPASQVTQVLIEFYGLLETDQYVVRGGHEYAARILTETFGEAKADELLSQVHRVRDRSTGDLAVLEKIEPQQLAKFLENEHPQTVALVLAHLDPKRGSALLMHLAPQLRVDAVRRLAEMRQFSPEMAQKVALVIHRRMDSLGSNGRRNYAGFKAVADLLNKMEQQMSKGILEDIEQNEPKVATEIRTLMFTFDDLLTVPQASIRELVSAADKRVLAVALKGGKENIKAHLFKAMSSRASEMLKEDMEAIGPVRMRDVSAAQQELLSLASRLEAEGRMVLKLEGADDVAV
jgi:flagellar motor switch protein FliG